VFSPLYDYLVEKIPLSVHLPISFHYFVFQTVAAELLKTHLLGIENQVMEEGNSFLHSNKLCPLCESFDQQGVLIMAECQVVESQTSVLFGLHLPDAETLEHYREFSLVPSSFPFNVFAVDSC
jgi:hypothetical protein